ncbi:cell division protein FtsQ/DivIB [Alteromonadaceae bacterium BrNp21-10]|nr:cell division protein FtsQ/DivIB [Alteromonadaceae bacterium BrNp21-10]
MADKQSSLLKPQFWLGVLFFGIVVYGAVITWQGIEDWLQDEQRLPVQKIVVAGERLFIKDDEVAKVIRQAQPGSFFELDVNKALAAVEAMPWVHKASLRKEWPSTLKVFLVEQVAVARWNSDSLINANGSLFNAELDGAPLPLLYGPGGSEQTALQGYKDMQQLLASSGLQIEELILSERFAWQVKLSNDIMLNIGRKEFIDRVQRFVDLLPLLAKNKKAVEYVDLRYDTGLAVGWKGESES